MWHPQDGVILRGRVVPPAEIASWFRMKRFALQVSPAMCILCDMNGWCVTCA